MAQETEAPGWLTVQRGQQPLLISLPHGGTLIPPAIEARLQSPWLGRKDTDWWIEMLYDFAGELGATVVRTSISRTVIDVNRHPDGAALYPGQASTELCPTTTFDGEPLYADGGGIPARDIDERRARYFVPYHAALVVELTRLRASHARVVLFDAHSIRSIVPRLFAGMLPALNLGTNHGRSCAAALLQSVTRIAQVSGQNWVADGRFKGGYITRHYGEPATGVHALQLELAMRSYLREPAAAALAPADWPPPYDPDFAAPLRATLQRVLQACLQFAHTPE